MKWILYCWLALAGLWIAAADVEALPGDAGGPAVAAAANVEPDGPDAEPTDPSLAIDELGIKYVATDEDGPLLSVHEVTHGQFERFAAATGHVSAGEREGGYGLKGGQVRWSAEFSWRDIGAPQRADHPAVNIRRADAEAFCAWLSHLEGRRCRLASAADLRRLDGNLLAVERHGLYWHQYVLASHPLLGPAIRKALPLLAGEAERRCAAPAALRRALASWNFPDAHDLPLGFRVVRERR